MVVFQIAPIEIDEVKLMQVFVNLFRNAKDSLLESSNPDKELIIKTAIVDQNKILVEITENGIGILPTNLNKIFNYGFTTKKSGHGFGLHASLLAIHELGGELKACSDGLEKGATFTLLLPYKRPRQ